jgi:DNA invertase Pin-like site-specific DNA recombinase
LVAGVFQQSVVQFQYLWLTDSANVISFDIEAMPRLNPQQREQAIGRLHAGQPARVIANDFNCNVRTIERLWVRYNATNSTNNDGNILDCWQLSVVQFQ